MINTNKKKIQRIGILPWVGTDDHQINFAMALQAAGYSVEKIIYKKGFPLHSALKQHPVDILVLDWVHSFYISNSVFVSLLKTFLQFWDRKLVRNRKTIIIWNMHNLHRHDKKFLHLEKFNFKKLAQCVNGIRVFNDFSIAEVRKYLGLKLNYPIVNIPQGQYYTRNNLSFDYSNENVVDFVILFFGSIRKGKGLDKFLVTFSKIENRNLKLIIAGAPVDDELIYIVKKEAEKDKRIIIIDRFIPEDEIEKLFELAFAIVLPYENILNSGVQLLAHSFSKPILANDIPVFRESLSPLCTEFFLLNDHNSLSEAIIKLKERDYGTMKIASASVLKNRQWNNIVDRFIAFAGNL